ncbi:molybdopterin-guanine dinucleotide biosynthesis protein B [Sporolactobacillus sp. THM7-7]|nr:molybdopterin-guanine dinucleotide biosynthesis protein B [Sporolactobacillus sp. THM7-7]
MKNLNTEPLILQITGYKNSGKTTAAEAMIRHLTRKGYHVGSFKHHGHESKPQLPDEKDSTRLFMAGAVASGISGGGMFEFSTTMSLDWLSLFRLAGVDVLIIEGLKHEPYDKIVCIRSKEEIGLLSRLPNIVAVISWIPLSYHKPVFSITDTDYCDWVAQYIEKKMKH